MLKPLHYISLSFLLCLWGCPLILNGENLQSAPLRALSVGYEQELRDLVILDANMQSSGQLSLRRFRFSKMFKCPIVDGQLVFGISDGINEKGTPQFREVASVEWKHSYGNSCLLFLPKSLKGETTPGSSEYSIQIVDMKTNSFKPGHIKIINTTPWRTMVRAGEHEKGIAAWEVAELSKIEEIGPSRMTQLIVSYTKEDSQYHAHQSRIRYLESTRYFVLIYTDMKTKRVTARLVKDSGSLFK